jgi:multisubunit Na+/H+ antiporter MnhB subunit
LKNKNVKKAALFSVICFSILCISDYIFSQTPSIAFIPLLTECSFFIVLIIYFFFEKIKQDANEPLFNTFIFWFAVAFLINFSGNFLLFVYSETSIKDIDYKTNYTIIYSTVTILKNILLCIAVTMKESLENRKNNGNDFLKNMNPAIFNPSKIETY